MEVVDVLNEQLNLLQKFVEFLEDETACLIKGNVSDMTDLVNKKRDFHDALTTLEDKRVELMGDITLKEYAHQSHDDLNKLVTAYQDLMPKVIQAMQRNEELIHMGLNHCDEVVSYISCAAKEKVNTYGKQGQLNQSEVKVASLINRQA